MIIKPTKAARTVSETISLDFRSTIVPEFFTSLVECDILALIMYSFRSSQSSQSLMSRVVF